MPLPKIPPPSKIDPITVPAFALDWYGTPSTSDSAASSNNKNPGVSILAYGGGGGSSKTGVSNKIAVDISTDEEGERRLEISTGDVSCYAVHLFRPHDDTTGMVRMLACVGDEVFLYGIPIFSQQAYENNYDSDEKEEAVLLGKVNVGKGYGANVTTFTQRFINGSMVQCVAVGCENGTLVLYELKQQPTSPPEVEFTKTAECAGHTKAICCISYHPRSPEILSSAKDGTVRIFCTTTGQQMALIKCEVHDPNGPPPKEYKEVKVKDPRMRKGPPQIIARGCLYGDLEGRVIYTVACGKKGVSYLSKYNTTSNPGEKEKSIQQEYRVQCAPHPVASVSPSKDGTLLSLGTCEGQILLYSMEKLKVLKSFQGHDLPVTCLASRPIPSVLMLPGEKEGGVNYDVLSASVDNRLGRWTLQKASRIRQKRSKREVGALESLFWSVARIPLLVLCLIFIVAVHDVFDLCVDEAGLTGLIMDMNAASHCVYREVLWAESSRAGVRSVPE